MLTPSFIAGSPQAGAETATAAEANPQPPRKTKQAKPVVVPEDDVAVVAKPAVGPKEGAKGAGEGPIMESLVVDGVLTKLEVFEDKAPGASALVRGPGSAVNRQSKQGKKDGKRRDSGGEKGGKGKAKKQAFGSGRGRRGKSKAARQ